MTMLETIELETTTEAKAVVIWLHGLGADGNDFVAVAEQLQMPAELGIRFIFPHAPVRPITINQGYQMRGWYDIRSLSIIEEEDKAGIIESSEHIRRICLSQQEQGIPAQRIILAGFSQGGAIALHCGLHYPEQLGGIMALSTYLPRCVDIESIPVQTNTTTPVFMAHGLQDTIVMPIYGEQSRKQLENAGISVEWHEYAMPHSVCDEEIRHIRRWLLAVLK